MQLRLACQYENAVEVTILPPYVPSESEKKDPKLYARNLRQLYAHTLQLPLVEQVSRCMLCCKLARQRDMCLDVQ